MGPTRRARRAAGALAAVLAALLLAAAPAGAESLDWTDVSWPQGTLGPYTFTGATVPELGPSQLTVQVFDPDNVAPGGWPRIEPNISGFDHSLRVRADFRTNADITSPNHESMRVDMTFGAPVTNVVFDIGDIDTGSRNSPYAGWQDIVIVTAFFQGVEVAVTATPLGSAVGLDTNGNDYSTALNASLYGRTGNIQNTQTDGNARIQVPGPVDLIRIDYYPGSGTDFLPGRGPSNPVSQVIQIHDPVFEAQADVSLTKQVSNSTPDVGETVTWTLTVANAGPTVATGVAVTDRVPAGLAYVPGSMAGGASRDESDPTSLVWTLANLAAGANAVLTFDTVVQAPTGASGEFRNVAEVTALDQPDPDSAPDNDDGDQSEDDEDFAEVAPQAVADLALQKTASALSPTVGDTVTFTLTLHNGGPDDATNVAVRDALPPGFTYVPGSLTGGTTRDESAAPLLDWTVASLASGGQAVLTFDAVVNAPTGAPGEHVNVAQVMASDQVDPDSTPGNDDGDQSEDDEAAAAVTPVAVAVSLAPEHQRTALPGSVVFFPHTFTASRDGTVAFTTAAAASPAIPGWTEMLFRDSDCSGGLDPGEPSFAPGAPLAVTGGAPLCVVVRENVPAGAPAGARNLVTLSASYLQGGAGTPIAASVEDLTTVTDDGGAGLELRKAVDKGTAAPGETVSYTLTYTNLGANPLTDLVISDSTPGFTTYVGGSATCAAPLPPALSACTPTAPAGGTAGALEWTFTGSLLPGQSGTVGYSVQIE